MALRLKVKTLYKQLLFLGRDYPTGYDKFRKQCHEAFMKHKDETDPKKIKALLAKGRYVCKEIEALYALKKYRTLKSSILIHRAEVKATKLKNQNKSNI